MNLPTLGFRGEKIKRFQIFFFPKFFVLTGHIAREHFNCAFTPRELAPLGLAACLFCNRVFRQQRSIALHTSRCAMGCEISSQGKCAKVERKLVIVKDVKFDIQDCGSTIGADWNCCFYLSCMGHFADNKQRSI